jgi:arginyl-tRNA synthetase
VFFVFVETLQNWLRPSFERVLGESGPACLELQVQATTNPEFGDYQCNNALPLAKALKRPPRDLATAVLQDAGTHPAVARAEIAGPGFINIFLTDAAVIDELERILVGDDVLLPSVGSDRTVVLDYSSPNVAKPMHIGHIRSTIIGCALDRMHRALGYTVIADNHIGDWGTQFGILLMGFKNLRDEAALEADPVAELERLYVASYTRSKDDAEWLDASRQELVKLQAGDTENRALWDKFRLWSMGEFDRVYKRLGVSFDLSRGESYYNDALPGMLTRLQDAGLARESEGAQVVFLEDEKLPVCIVQKSDGGFNYATTDLATVASRVDEFDPERIIYVTDERQQLHFRQFFAICAKLGIKTQLSHVYFGLMRLPEGTISTREGNIIKLEALLDEAERRALTLVQASSTEMPAEQQQDVARAVGIGAVKYADLSQNPQTNITFTWDKALALDGNSGPYLQYAQARICSVKDKFHTAFPDANFADCAVVFSEPIERTLALKLTRYPDEVARATRLFKPNIIADYLYDLSQAYSSFYQNVPFLKAEEGLRESRLRLCAGVGAVLRHGLGLLGIETPERI